jgi:hypothetical protein
LVLDYYVLNDSDFLLNRYWKNILMEDDLLKINIYSISVLTEESILKASLKK